MLCSLWTGGHFLGQSPVLDAENLPFMDLGEKLFIRIGTRDKNLNVIDVMKEIALTFLIQLREDIVEEKDRILTEKRFRNPDLRQLEGEGDRPLLPLRSVFLRILIID